MKLGEFIHMEYIDANASSRLEDVNDSTLSPTDVISYSSNLPRTLLSARAFLRGMLEHTVIQKANRVAMRVATMAFNGSETDWRIRGYANCPTLSNKLEAFMKTDAYKQRKKSDEDFVNKLGRELKTKQFETNFDHVFNIYDRYTLSFYGYDDNPDGPVRKLSMAEMTRLRKTVDWVESRKLHFGTHGLQVGGGLLDEMVRQVNSGRFKVVEYSGHYATLLTLLAAMRGNKEGDATYPGNELPRFGTALVMEVHEENGKKSVRMRWVTANGPEEDYIAKDFAVGRDGCTDKTKRCEWKTLERGWDVDKMGLKKFCEDCGQESMVCLTRAAIETSRRCSTGGKVGAGVGGAVGGMIVGVIGAMGYTAWSAKRKNAGASTTWTDDGDQYQYEGDVRM